MERIGIIGLGYVGLPLASAFATAGHSVVGYDIDRQKIETLRAGTAVESPMTIGGPASEHDEREPTYTTNAARLQECDVLITAVPTPLTEAAEPDLSNVRSAGRTIGEHLTAGTTVVLESTVYPGATREEFVPELERASGLVLGEDFDVGYSPERINPGDEHSLRNSVKPVSGHTDTVRSFLMDLYGDIVDELYPAPSIESAEAAKCLENTQRDLNIALINEFAMACHETDSLDYEAVLSVADTKWNFQRYSPGLVEGHCIPIDPYFLINRLEEYGASVSLMREARNVNEFVTDFIVRLTEEAVSEREERAEGDDTGTRIVVCGLSYKPNTADLRSRVKPELFDALRTIGVEPIGYDPHVDQSEAAAVFDLEMWPSIDTGEADGVLVLTAHDELTTLTLDEVVDACQERPIVVDTPRVFDEPTETDVVYRRF
ncbi:nucleotide sugar dehydrogenase [Natrinema sp. DC36]|uniref:nucleotide sugar dehydrogenase n=1 Tax=Natrinema sp. DC36 TaxID=2878680 RepID=UPI001CEFDB9A|nr:nucleotide sugar dehydrogenase [Natrinema sp. DC36]